MPVQTSTDYLAAHVAGFEGQKVDLELTNITSKVVETALGIPFGRAVVRGTADNQTKLPTATGQAFVGVTEMTSAGVEDADAVHQYEYQREANIIDFGKLYVYTEQSVVPGNAVYFRHTADTAPLDVVGRFRKDASGTDADLIQGATWETTTAAGGIGIIKLNAPGTGVLLAPNSSETLTVAGAASISTEITYFDSTAGAMAVTLADGVEGQIKYLTMLVDGGDVTVTPDNYANGTTIVHNDAFDSCKLRFSGTQWHLEEAVGSIGRGIDAGDITILASGAIPITKDVILINSTSGVQALTLADGTYTGQRMTTKMIAGANNSVITPANFLDGTTITFTGSALNSADLIFDGTNWTVIGTATATVA